MCAENDALFIVNDYLDIALACDADGLHVGQEDLPVSSARALLPIDKLIGCSVTGAAEAQKARGDGADYLACGAIYATSTKPACPVVGLERLTQIKKAVDLPLVAIGGINIHNLPDIFAAGADARGRHQRGGAGEVAGAGSQGNAGKDRGVPWAD